MAPHSSFELRLQDWLDGRMTDASRMAFEEELSADPKKREVAKRLQAIDDALQHLNEGVERENIPARLLDIVGVKTDQPKKNHG